MDHWIMKLGQILKKTCMHAHSAWIDKTLNTHTEVIYTVFNRSTPIETGISHCWSMKTHHGKLTIPFTEWETDRFTVSVPGWEINFPDSTTSNKLNGKHIFHTGHWYFPLLKCENP